MLNGKAMMVDLIAGLIKKIWCDFINWNYAKMSRFIPRLYKPFGKGMY